MPCARARPAGRLAVTLAPLAPPEPPHALWLLDDGLIMGGGQLFALRLACWARRPVTIVCPEGSGLWERATAQGLPCVAADFPEPSGAHAPAMVAAARRLRRVLGATTAGRDVVVSGGIRCSLVAASALAARRGAPPLVHLMHERDSAQRGSVRLALRRSRRVVAMGSVAAAAYRTALPGARVVQVNNFLAPDVLDQLVAARAARRAVEAPGALRLGVLARVIPEKGVAALVDELVAAPGAWGTLAVAGALQDADEVARVRSRIQAAGLGTRVTLRGAVDDVPAFLDDLDALVVPSTGNEGQPTVILEAVAAGLPVIARAPLVSQDFAGLPVVPYTGPADLAGALAEVTALGAAPAERLRERFGVGQVLAAIEQAAS